MTKKQLFFTLLSAAILVAVIFLILFLPRPLVSSPYQLSDKISSRADVIVTGVRYDGENVTALVDHADLLKILTRYSRSFAPWRSAGPYDTADTWEIDLNQGGKSLHIVLGADGHCYRASRSTFRILRSGDLRQELFTLLN